MQSLSEKKSLHIPSRADALPKHWRWERLDEICDGVFDCPHSTPVLTNDGPFVVRSQDVRSGIFRMEEAGRVSDETYQERIARAEPRHGDLVYSREGTYFGIAAELPPGVRVCLGQRMVLLRPSEHKANFRFLRYWLNSPVMARHIQGQRDGTVAERLNMPTIRALPVALPPLSEQRAVAAVLGALDDKIELNRRMNETLEAMARALFQNWFVDATQAVLPKGWRDGKLRDCCERVENGGTPSRNVPDYWQPQEVPWLTSGEVRQKIVAATENFISRAGLENSSAKLWQKETTVVALYGATAGQVTLLGSEMCSNQACCALIPKSGWRFYVYLHTSSSIQALEQQVRGSAQQNLSQQIVADLPTLLPDNHTIAKFDSVVTPLIERWICNLFETRTLAALRDALLPKLLSGELRMPAGVGRLVEAHT